MKDGVSNKIGILRYEISNFLDAKLKENGISDLHTSHGAIIFYLLKYERLSMMELSNYIHRDKSTLTVLIKKLVKKEYVTVVQSQKDRRSKIISLTKKGKEIEQVYNQISIELNNRIWNTIDDKEAEDFMTTLNKLISNMGVKE